jgi:Squalene-hopene cyclase C-terminal domain
MSTEQDIKWLDDIIASGVGFLLQNLGSKFTNLWSDFSLTGVSIGSTEWVSAFIAAQIGDIPEARTLAKRVVQIIASQARQTGGWGYREDVPEDCDSTAWVLLASASVNLQVPLVERSLQFILEHQRDDGGFATFGSTAKKTMETLDRAGWFEPEVSVTSAAVLAMISTGSDLSDPVYRACSYISEHRSGDLWESYWWNGFAYATYHSLLALSKVGGVREEEQIVIAAQAILQMQSPVGGWTNERGTPDNGFSTSFALRSILLADKTLTCIDSVMKSIQFLAKLQTNTGAFLPSTEMLAPGGLNSFNLLLRDNGLMTTACVVKALHEVRSRLSEVRIHLL